MLTEAITATVGSLSLPSVAVDGDCIPVSDTICSALRSAGLDARVGMVTGTVTFLGVEAVAWLHFVVRVNGLVVDATATQFDSGLPPLIVASDRDYEDIIARATDAVVTVGDVFGA